MRQIDRCVLAINADRPASNSLFMKAINSNRPWNKRGVIIAMQPRTGKKQSGRSGKMDQINDNLLLLDTKGIKNNSI